MDKEKVIKQYQIPNCKAFCIYALYSDYDNKYFVGLTSDIRKRGLLLIYNLLSGYCTNQKLQSAFSRHPKSFHFLVLEENSDPLAAFDHANKIVQTLDTIRNGFNLVPIKKPRHAGGYSDYELTHGIDVSGINLPAYNGTAVYIITDHLTSRFYIGSTAEFENRLKTHIYTLRAGNHPNPEMQAAFSDHPDSFTFSIMHRCSTEEEARKLEAIEIQSRNAIAYGFNRTNNLKLLPIVETCKRKSTSQNSTVFFFFFDIAS